MTTCRCTHADACECLRERAPWIDTDDARVHCLCACHEYAKIDLASDDLDDDSEGVVAA